MPVRAPWRSTAASRPTRQRAGTSRWSCAATSNTGASRATPPNSAADFRYDAPARMQPAMNHLASAGELVAAKRFGEAEGEILRALSDAPRNVQALNLLALVRYKLGRLEEAHATYREIAGASPQDAHARRNLGLIALKLGNVDEALPELEMAVRLTPGDERAWSYLGYAYAKKGEVVEAAAAFRRAGQDALALELEHAATVRRPPTPLRYSSSIAAADSDRSGLHSETRGRTPAMTGRAKTAVGAHA